jgi:hypothetical protein
MINAFSAEANSIQIALIIIIFILKYEIYQERCIADVKEV